jgi:hypothetical protein
LFEVFFAHIQVSHIFQSILDQLSHDSASCGEDECFGNLALQFRSLTAANQKHAASKRNIPAAVGVLTPPFLGFFHVHPCSKKMRCWTFLIRIFTDGTHKSQLSEHHPAKLDLLGAL